MHDYVIFSLVAPMGSFGDLAGHAIRGGYSWPGRSAILGLIGGALGVRRDDPVGQSALANWEISVSVLSKSTLFEDFHTVQTVPKPRIKRPSTRRVALGKLKPKDRVVVTRREYHSDCAFGIALRGGDQTAVVSALREPAFIPYLGRKSFRTKELSVECAN